LVVFTIGIDPHKGSHLAAVLNEHEELLDELRVRADHRQRERLLTFAAPYTPRVWAVEGARGLGSLVAQQLVAAGETVLDVPAKLSARVRSLDNECSDKNDAHDARSAAIVGMHNRRLLQVAPENHAMVLRVLAKRHHDLTARRTQSICRLHAVLVMMVPGGLPRLLSADRAARELRTVKPTDSVGAERRRACLELLTEVRDADRQLRELRSRIVAAVRAADTTVTNVYGVGPIVAAYLIGYTGDVTRFATKARYARYNATAPIEASSGPKPRHRLNRKGNRQLNHALHMAAVTQISHDSTGRDYYQRKLAETQSTKDAMRALKRRISDAVYTRLQADATR
jgi:transposase